MSDSVVNEAPGGEGEARKPEIGSDPMKDNHACARAREAAADWLKDRSATHPIPPRVAGATAQSLMVDAFLEGARWADERLAGLIASCGELFRFYESHHRDKLRALEERALQIRASASGLTDAAFDELTAQIDAAAGKVTRNQLAAIRCETALRCMIPPKGRAPVGFNPHSAVEHDGMDEPEDTYDGLFPGDPGYQRAAGEVRLTEGAGAVTDIDQARRKAVNTRGTDRTAPRGLSNLRDPSEPALMDPEIVEGLLASAGATDATVGATFRMEGVADLVAFRINTGDPKFDPDRPLTVNGFLYHPARKD